MKLSSRHERLLRHTFIDFQQTAEFIESPLIFDRAEGLYYWDIEGKRYFDAIGGVFVAVLGHGHPRVLAALQRQMERLTFAPPLHGIADVTLDFVEKLGSITPGNLNFVKAFSGGSESIEAAMKFTRQYFKQAGHPGKYKFISLYLSYHGGTLATTAVGGGSQRKTKFEPLMGGYLKLPSPIQYRDRFASWEETNRFCARMFEDVIVSEDPGTVAGVVIEPICNTAGIVAPTREYFEILRDTCTRHNVILIFDEVLTGFGKTGDMFAAQTYSVVPDIICSGKGLSSGVIPIGAMMAREDLADAFYGPAADNVQFAHGHTFAGNPLACAAGIAVINELVERQLDVKARRLGAHLEGRLDGLRDIGIVREIRGCGVLRGVELVQDAETNEPFPAGAKLGDALKRTAAENGLIMRISPDWFAVSPALVADEDDIDEMYDLIEKSVREALDQVTRRMTRA
ncbi:MAG: aminotransferase class III-fold pyridoxal phosphate-dependent enzyme [Anaerolineae bacterium]|nr:aminotransferase class III-fold pyridoxal phosphate-dependent enzyme [Anaerolineae bacterium]